MSVKPTSGPRALFVDVGGTLLQGRADISPRELSLARLVDRFGPRDWFGPLLDADLLTAMLADDPDEPFRQRTLAAVSRWLSQRGIGPDGIDLDELRRTCVVPGSVHGELAPGAREALAWARDRGMRVILVSNTLWSAAEDMAADFPGLEIATLVDGVVTSHSIGYRKPHPAIFERALSLAGVAPHAAVMVGDEPYQDVFGAQRVGMRAVWVRPRSPRARPVGEPDGFVVRADAEIESLAELPPILERWTVRG
jgi:FMN phosphatase YigB (HAD superfamily)